MAKAAIELRYVAADDAERAPGLLRLAALLERAARVPGAPSPGDRGLIDFVEHMMSGRRDMLRRS